MAAEVRNGCPGRLPDLLGASAGLVHALVRADLGDGLLADEAATDALARIAAAVPRLRDARAYPRWVARIVAHAVADAARRGRSGAVALPEEVPDPAAGPARATRSAERARLVRHAVRGLPPKLRAPVLLHFAEGLSYREVAAALGVGLGTVSRRMGKAFGALRRTLKEEP